MSTARAPAWEAIDAVLLDMDGTLLDLHFDSHFWLEHLPLRYAERHGISVEAARQRLVPMLQAAEGTLAWYCLDHWSRELELDVAELKHEVEHLISLRPHALEFLASLRRQGKRTVLVTNAHARSLSLKLARTGLGALLDAIVCAHDLGYAKEDIAFWHALQAHEPFTPGTTLLIDDNLAALRSARDYGIRYLLGVEQPDSRRPPRDAAEFPAVASFRDIMPGGRTPQG